MVPSCEPTASLGSVANQTAAPIMNGDAGPPKNAANFAALTPLHFLERAAEVFPERPKDALLVTSLPAEIVC